ncbi:DNA polymerase III subunit delta' [Singulisphaera sp. Ch08]|uniref:DNA polymerase III subunit delta n=1 Tax=Singulisphaera sp. Ch08 TaxID=3120278 RepID=A0AAU7CNK0_9BACT
MAWHSVRGHDRVVESLRNSLTQGRFPHAFLFVGPDGIGKRTFALTLAQALLCEQADPTALNPCQKCPSCTQVKAGNHPDVLQVARPEDKHELPIKVIRGLCLDLGLKPARGGRKLAIVDDADDMNEEAANAFLKTLEEPPDKSVLILIGTSAELQLETIISRCRVVRFEPLPETELAALLLEQNVAHDSTEATRLAKLGEGSVARARGLADPELDHFRRALIDDLASPRGFDPPASAARLTLFVNELKESVDKRARASLLIGELAHFFRGILWQTAGLAPPCPDPSDRGAVTSLANRLDPESVLVLADRCIEADYHIRRKVNLNLIFDSLMHDLGALINPRG